MVQQVSQALLQNPSRKNIIINGDMRIDQRQDNVIADLSTFAPSVVDTNAATTFVDNNAIGVLGGTNTASTFTQGAINGTFSAYRIVSGLVIGEIYKVSVFVKLGTATNFVIHANNQSVSAYTGTHTEATTADGFNTTNYKELSFTFTATNTAANIHIGNKPDEVGLPIQSNGTVFLSNMKLIKAGAQSIGIFSLDRFYNLINNASATSVSRMFSEQVIRPLADNKYASRVTTHIAETSGYPVNDYNYGVTVPLEGQDIPKKGDLTVSFKFTSNVSGTFPVSIRANLYTDSYIHEFNYTTPGIEQTISFTLPTSNKFIVDDNSIGLQLTIGFINTGTYQTVTANKDSWIVGNFSTTDNCVNWSTAIGNYIEVTDVQLEEGVVATDFERRTYAEELRLCQRYYEKLSGDYGVSYNGSLSNSYVGSTAIDFISKRAIPTGSIGALAASNANLSIRTRINSVYMACTAGYYYWKDTILDAEL